MSLGVLGAALVGVCGLLPLFLCRGRALLGTWDPAKPDAQPQKGFSGSCRDLAQLSVQRPPAAQ